MIEERPTGVDRAGALPPPPYKGLAPFEDSEVDALFFFGREREREIITANLMASPLTVLFGPSGVGKSSLLRAGVAVPLRALARRNLEDRGEPEFAVVVFASWRGDPAADLRNAVEDAVDDLLGEAGAEPPAAEASLADAMTAANRRIGGDLYLILDQIEEYFLYHGDDSGAGTLLRELPDVVNRRGVRVNVVLAIREDELAKLDAFKPRIPNLFANSLRLDRLDRTAARAAVLGPLDRYNALATGGTPVSAEPSLVEAVLDDVATGRIDSGLAGRGAVAPGREAGHVETPYLQLVMQRLWDVERSEGSFVLRLETLRRLGGAQRIVEDHLERAMTSLTPHAQDVAAVMFAHLVTPSGAKIAHALPDLASYAAASEVEADEVVRSLAEQRILRPLGDGGDGDGRYEIFHDVLGEAVLAWRTRHGAQRDVERERAAARARHRRLTRLVAAALVALVVVGAVAVYALLQRREANAQARAAQARELAATAFSQLSSDPELSMLLALEAARRERTPQVEEALRRALLESRQRFVLDLGAGRRVLAATPVGRRSAAVAVADDGVLRSFDLEPARLVRSVSLAGPVRLASFSGEGELLVTVGGASTVRLWRAATGERIAGYPHTTSVRAAAVSDDGRFLATAGADRRVRVLAARTGRVVRSFALEPVPSSVALSGDGSRVAVGATDGTTRIWTTGPGEPVARLVGHTGWVVTATFDATGDVVATGSTDGTARVWKVSSGDLLAVMTGHGNFVTSTAFGDDRRVLVTGSRDRTARVWDAASGRALAVFRGHRDSVQAASLDRRGDLAVTAGLDGTARVWDVRTEPRLELVRQFGDPVTGIAASTNGLLVAAAGQAAVVSQPGSSDRTLQHEREVAAVSVSADGRSAATAAGRQVFLWDTATGRTVRGFANPALVTAVSLSRDGALVATGGADGVARVWRTDDEDEPVREFASAGGVNGVAFDAGGERLVTAGRDGVARIWSVPTGDLVRELQGHKEAVTAAEFSADGRLVVTASADHDGRVWEAETGRGVAVLSGHFGRVSDAALSGDNRWVTTAGPASAALWEARTGRLVFYLRGHEGVLTSAEFVGRDNRILTAAADGTVRAYRCDICADLDALVALATDRLGQTGRALTPGERRRYLRDD